LLTNKTNRHQGTALITGASEGIGSELAGIMAADGWDLAITARRGELLDRLADELTGRYAQRVEVIPADLARPEAPDEIFGRLSGKGITIEALVNNAGVGYYGEFIRQDLNRILDMISLNIGGLVRLSHIFQRDMVRRGRGRIMNVASLVSFTAMPLHAVYAATKAFTLSFSEAQARELRGTGVTVTALCPGFTRSGFYRAAGGEGRARSAFGLMSARSVARIGYRAMMKGRLIVIAGGSNKLMAFSTRLVPRRITGLGAFTIMKQLLRKAR